MHAYKMPNLFKHFSRKLGSAQVGFLLAPYLLGCCREIGSWLPVVWWSGGLVVPFPYDYIVKWWSGGLVARWSGGLVVWWSDPKV